MTDEEVIYGSLYLAVATLISQVAAAYRRPRSYKGFFSLRVPLFALWALANCFGLLMAIMANYCESNCHAQPLNGATALIAGVLLLVNLVVTWAAWDAIPLAIRSGKMSLGIFLCSEA